MHTGRRNEASRLAVHLPDASEDLGVTGFTGELLARG
jgi:hypothetical protein